jgi:hypothetical protein
MFQNQFNWAVKWISKTVILTGKSRFLPFVVGFNNLTTFYEYLWLPINNQVVFGQKAYILFPTELHLKNVYYLYSVCSNPTDGVWVIVLSMIIGKGLENGTA